MENNLNKYDASSIEVLEGLEAVRKRPGMYIGSTDTYGLHHLVWEIVSNAVDEALNGFGKKIFVVIHKDNSITITDEGRGIPCDIHPKTGVPAIQTILTTLHSGGKFNDNSYKSSGGLHGVGSSVTNALSTFMDVTVLRDGNVYHISFKNGGKLDEPLKVLGHTNKHGSTITFKPDPSIFKTTEFSYEKIYNYLKESAFLLKGVYFYLIDEREGKKEEFFYENGIKEYLNEFSVGKKSLGEPVYFENDIDNIHVEVAFEYFYEYYEENIKSYVNNIRTIDGGTHEMGFKLGITRAVNDYVENNGLSKSKTKLEGNDIREGLTAIISLRLPESIAIFEGQTKTKLGTSQAQTVLNNFIYTSFTYYLNENKDFAINLIKKCQDAQLARLAARKAKEETRNKKKSQKEQIILSDKLTPAQSKDYKQNELFIVEGNSAGGSAKKGRDPKYQAILPLRGKPLNTNDETLSKIMQNQEIATIVNTIAGGVGNEFDVEDIHYDKVIIMTDADTDGAHIQTLLLTFFYNYMKDLIVDGHVFIAMAPLYKVSKNEKGKKYVKYCYNETDLEDAKAECGKGYDIQRYKGLGEMDASELKYTTMDKNHRVLTKVSIHDALICANKINVLMGKDADKRKKWLEESVDFNENDDFIKELTK